MRRQCAIGLTRREWVVEEAEREATVNGVRPVDVLHIAAAMPAVADELVTSGCPGRAIFRMSS